MVRVATNVRVARNSSWPASTTTHASEPEQSTLTWGFSISTASVQLTQQQPSILLWRYNPSPYVFTVCFKSEKGEAGVHNITPPPTHPPLRMQWGSQLVSITITLLGKGRTGSCGQTHEEDKWCWLVKQTRPSFRAEPAHNWLWWSFNSSRQLSCRLVIFAPYTFHTYSI